MPRPPWHPVSQAGLPVPQPRTSPARATWNGILAGGLLLVGTAPWLYFSGLGLYEGGLRSLLAAPFVLFAWLMYGLPFVLLGRGIWQQRTPTGPTFQVTTRIPIRRAWWDLARLGRRRGLRIHLEVEAWGFVGRALELVVRFKSAAGDYLPATLRRYQGPYGELRVRHRTAALKNPEGRFPDLWIFLPTRALPIPPGTERYACRAEILLGIDGEVHTEHELEIRFVPTAEDFSDLLPSGTESEPPPPAQAPDGAIQFLGASPTPDSSASCGVCGEGLSPPTHSCPLCHTPAHLDCWTFIGGCSVYGCEGRARDAP